MFEPSLILSPLALCIFGVAAIILGLKSYRSYRNTRNPLGLSSMVFGVGLGAALIIIGLPFLLTRNETILLFADYIGVIGVVIGILGLAHLLWFANLRGKIPFSYLAAPLIILGVAILLSDVASTQVVEQEGVLVYQSSQLSLWLKALLYVIVGWPLAYFYLYRARQQASLKTKLKLGCLGVVAFLVSTSAIIENLTSGGQSDESGGFGRLVLAIATLLYALWPRQATAAEETKAAVPDSPQQPVQPSMNPAAGDYTAEHPDKTLNQPQARL